MVMSWLEVFTFLMVRIEMFTHRYPDHTHLIALLECLAVGQLVQYIPRMVKAVINILIIIFSRMRIAQCDTVYQLEIFAACQRLEPGAGLAGMEGCNVWDCGEEIHAKKGTTTMSRLWDGFSQLHQPAGVSVYYFPSVSELGLPVL